MQVGLIQEGAEPTGGWGRAALNGRAWHWESIGTSVGGGYLASGASLLEVTAVSYGEGDHVVVRLDPVKGEAGFAVRRGGWGEEREAGTVKGVFGKVALLLVCSQGFLQNPRPHIPKPRPRTPHSRLQPPSPRPSN